MAKVLDNGLKLHEFEFQSRYYVLLLTKTTGKYINHHTPHLVWAKVTITAVLLQGLKRHETKKQKQKPHENELDKSKRA